MSSHRDQGDFTLTDCAHCHAPNLTVVAPGARYGWQSYFTTVIIKRSQPWGGTVHGVESPFAHSCEK
jgi:hypothetical protein